jgi:rod shape-determining protein MreD
MNKIIGILLIFVFLLLQIALVPHFSFFAVQANILLAAIIVFALMRSGQWVYVFAFFSGLALDVFSSRPFGIYAMSFVLLVWLIQFVGKNIFRASDFSGQASIAILSCAFFSLICPFLIKIFYWLGLGQNISFWDNLFRIGLPEIILNFILAILGLIIFKKTYGLFARI